MGKEFNTVENNAEILETTVDQTPVELSDLNLCLVGGGLGSVSF